MPLKFQVVLLLLSPFFLNAQEFKKLNQLNSPYRETNLSITPNGKYLYFMSQRGGQDWSSIGYSALSETEVEYDGDIWCSQFQNGSWQKPQVISPPVNTSNGEDEPSISMDGQTVYFQSWREDWQSLGGPYYKAKLNGNKWTNLVGLGGAINEFFRDQYRVYEYVNLRNSSVWDLLYGNSATFGTDGMAVSPDGKIFVVSVTNFQKGKKNMDLFISWKGKNGQWSYPKLLSINTQAAEISAFIAGDNKTLYFASNRSGGLGGYDIYKTTLKGGTACSTPTNLGAPYNTTRDDYSFIVNALGDKGYMVRNGDIYEFKPNEKAKPERTLVVNGIVKTDQGKPLAARIHVAINQNLISSASSNSLSGEYTFAIPWKSGNYFQTATLPDGRFLNLDFEITENTQSPLKFEFIFPTPEEEGIKEEPQKQPASILSDAAKQLDKQSLEKGKTILIDNLNFAADATEIHPASYPILDQIAEILKKRSRVLIEIGGHTNGVPPHEYCDQLSTARAKAVYSYLVSKGVAPASLQYKGYGKRQPIASNETKAGRTKNQRVEFKVLGEIEKANKVSEKE